MKTDMQLTDVKWMDPALAERLTSEGVTVEALAAMEPADLLKAHPYVGTINAWLLTSEAAYLINAVRAGTLEPERVKHERIMESLEEMSTAQYRQKPEMQWPPPPRPPKQYSVRIRRMRQAAGLPVDNVEDGL